MSEGWQRHDLLQIDPGGWRHALSLRADLSGVTILHSWADNGWPVMVRRYSANDLPDLIPVAVSLPRLDGRAAGSAGVALQVGRAEVMARLRAVSLSDALMSAPAHWRASLRCLHAMGERCGARPAVFGSLLWQRLTGASYLRAGSDLDLIWPVTRQAQAQELADAIHACASASPMLIDGEFILPHGGAVNWREFHARHQRVLVKTLHGVEDLERQRLFDLRAEWELIR